MKARQLKPLLGRTLVVVAHPDDEAIGCGRLLQRMSSAQVVFATDGAPWDSVWWQEFGSRENYAVARRKEAIQVASLVGGGEPLFLADHRPGTFVDQDLFKHVAEAVPLICGIARRIRPQAILTLAYEGGHPDHDSCSFISAMAARALSLPVWEMPLYHRTPEGVVRRQQFLSVQQAEVPIDAVPKEIETKRAMFSAYETQREVLAEFDAAGAEVVRPQPAYNYALPPSEGVLNYEAWGWPITGKEVSAAFERYPQASSSPRTLAQRRA